MDWGIRIGDWRFKDTRGGLTGFECFEKGIERELLKTIDMKSKYTDALRALFHEDNYIERFEEWLMEQPMLDQPDILREFVSIANSLLEKSGAAVPEIPEFENLLEDVEDKILRLHLIEQLEEVEKLEKEATIQERKKYIEEHRPELIAVILANPPEIEELLSLARNIAMAEMEMNIYAPENWKEIIDLMQGL